jgi:hypothetical protein
VENVDAGPSCPDSDHDGVCDAVDKCPGHDDRKDQDGDGVPDACDVCPGGDDKVDTDHDGVPDVCDVCPNDAHDDSDHDTVCDSADKCPGFDDRIDSDGDGVPDGCDPFPNCSGTVDTDGDGVCDSMDQCPGAPDGWGMAGQDLDNDQIDDGCDACRGLNSMGDSDHDGVCNTVGTDDACPGSSDFAPACPSTCAALGVASTTCSDLPLRGYTGNANDTGWLSCPAGSVAVGIKTTVYSGQGAVLGAYLVCKDTTSGAVTYVGKYGGTPTEIEYEIRCDQTFADGRLVGQIGTFNPSSQIGRLGAVCSSKSGAVSWTLQPVNPPAGQPKWADMCSGAGEAVTGIHLRYSSWLYAFQLTCSAVP